MLLEPHKNSPCDKFFFQTTFVDINKESKARGTRPQSDGLGITANTTHVNGAEPQAEKALKHPSP